MLATCEAPADYALVLLLFCHGDEPGSSAVESFEQARMSLSPVGFDYFRSPSCRDIRIVFPQLACLSRLVIWVGLQKDETSKLTFQCVCVVARGLERTLQNTISGGSL